MASIKVAGAAGVAAFCVAGCGVNAAVLTRGVTGAASSPSATPAPTVAPQPAPAYIAVRIAGSHGQEQLEILSTRGAVVAATPLTSTEPWSATTGPAGVFWIDNGTVRELTTTASVLTVASVPATVTAMVVSPDGGAYAYATSTAIGTSGSVFDNRIYAQRFGAGAHLVVDRVSDLSQPAADAPPSWAYYLINWTDNGILLARVPQGGCGCGPFDMQMQSSNTALINPFTAATTAVTDDAACPLSGLGAHAETACFAVSNQSGGATQLRVMHAGSVIQRFGMSGQSVAGDAVFAGDASSVAYLTVPLADASCGGTMASTLHVLTLASGTANATAITGLDLIDWLSSGAIYGQVDAATAMTIVTVDPTTLHASTLWTGSTGSSLVGLIGV